MNASRKLSQAGLTKSILSSPLSVNAADIYFIPRNASNPLFKMKRAATESAGEWHGSRFETFKY